MNTALPFAWLALIDDPTPRDAALNMAIDEVMLNALGGEPVLRIYRWAQSAVSIGYFDAAQPVADRWPQREIVRRWTGGGVVEHGHDLTFSLLVPRALPLAKLTASESYRFIHLAVAEALVTSGGPAATLSETATNTLSRACFENPVPHDLLAGGRKVAGGAQRRTQSGLLHQGSIQVGGIAALARALPGAFGLVSEPRALTAAELTAASVLATTKYGTSEWLGGF